MNKPPGRPGNSTPFLIKGKVQFGNSDCRHIPQYWVVFFFTMQIQEHNRGQRVHSLCLRVRGYFCVTCLQASLSLMPGLSKYWNFHSQTYHWDLPAWNCLCLRFKLDLKSIQPVLLVALGSTYCPAFLKDGEDGLWRETQLVRRAWNWSLEGKWEQVQIQLQIYTLW